MDKITYLAELAEGLARWVPERERQDILRYYAEYFEEAGPGKEGDVIAELGDPWALSCRLAVEGGYVTQEAANSWTPPRKKTKVWPFVLAGAMACVAIVAVSVGMMASRIGRVVGGFVGGSAANQALVEEDPDYAWAVPIIPHEPGVAYIEGEEMSDGIWSMEDGNLDAFDSVDVEISLGNITITGGEDYTLAIQQSGDLGGYRLNWSVEDGTLKIRDGSEGGHHIGFEELGTVFGKTAMDVVITVPDTARLGRVTAKSDMGDVFVSDLAAEKVTAETDMGDVQCYEVSGVKKLDLKSDMGDVTIGMGGLEDGVDIDLETSMGTVEANMGCYERDCAYEVKTDMGTVRVNGRDYGSKAEQKGNMPYKLDIEDDMGDVNVYFYTGQGG